jgi:hypothetical protein
VDYVINNLVSYGGSTYVCLVNNIAGASFATDLAAGLWALFAQQGASGLLPANNLSDVIDAGVSLSNLQGVNKSSLANQTYTAYTTGGTSSAYTVTASPALTTYTNARLALTLNATPTGSPTMNWNALGAKNWKYYDALGNKQFVTSTQALINQITDNWYDGTDVILLNPLSSIYTAIRSYLAGCTLSTAGSSATMSIAAGQAMDSTNVTSMTLAAIAKITSAWVVGTGNGGIDTGTIANSTWYYFYAIRRPDTGVVDCIFSLSSSAPTLPANYTQYRYIGAGFTNGSAQWTAFTQFGDEFYWSTPILDRSSAASLTAALVTCSVPRGRKVKAYFNIGCAAANTGPYLSDPANADLAPSSTIAPLAAFYNGGSGNLVLNANCWTNTSAQIRTRELVASGTIYMVTLGWIDSRDRNL